MFGANSWLTGFYHGALLAGAQMAQAVGDIDAAKEYAELYQRGRTITPALLHSSMKPGCISVG